VSLPLSGKTPEIVREDGELVFRREELTYRARVYPALMGRLRATVKLGRGARFHVDTLDLYSSRSRTEFGRRVAKALDVDAESVEKHLLELVVEAEKLEEPAETEASKPPPMSEADKREALAFLQEKDLLEEELQKAWDECDDCTLYLVTFSTKVTTSCSFGGFGATTPSTKDSANPNDDRGSMWDHLLDAIMPDAFVVSGSSAGFFQGGLGAGGGREYGPHVRDAWLENLRSGGLFWSWHAWRRRCPRIRFHSELEAAVRLHQALR